MRTKELLKFLQKRIKSDTPLAFVCRLLRFAVIACYLPERMMNIRNLECVLGSEISNIQKNILGNQMLLSMEDKGLSRDLMLGDIREPYITQILRKELQPEDICLEIGANIGYYALQEARLTRKVYAIEPVQENVELLMRNVKINKFKNVEVYRLACGDDKRIVNINVSQNKNWSSIIPSNNRDFIRRDEVQMVKVDDFIQLDGFPTFIRMDVEGYEYEVIKGMDKLLSSRCPLKMFIEMHFDILRDKTVGLCQILKDSGFEVKYATFEPHPAIMKSYVGLKVARLFEKGIGAQSGIVKCTIDDFINNRKYRSGQIEYLEVLFERK